MQNIDRAQADRIGTIQDLFAQIITLHHNDPDVLQTQIEMLVVQNKDISKFKIVSDYNNTLRVVSALNADEHDSVQLNAGMYRTALQNEGQSYRIEFIDPQSNDRMWHVYRAVRADSGELFYIYTELNFNDIDALLQQRITTTYIWFVCILAIVLFLAYRHIRLTDYEYLYRAAKKNIETRDLFTSMVTHELRAPLTAIRGYASMVTESNDIQPSTREHVTRIQESSERLLLLVNDLLEVARLQSGSITIVREMVDVGRTIETVLDSLKSSALEKNISLESSLPHDSVQFSTDPKRLQQVLINLVSNAIKYTPHGSIKVILKTLPSGIEIRVQDTGTGIDAENQKKLFSPFFRVESESVTAITGTGLGMWITKEFVRLLNGTISVESIEGVGTHVVVKFKQS